MSELEEAYLVRGKIKKDGDSLGGERTGGEAGLASENKIRIDAPSL
jgi:hypothetical protein